MKNPAFIVFLIFLFTVASFAQTADRGQVAGMVIDSFGAAVANADVRLINVWQIVFGTAKSDEEGKYRFENIADGSYIIIASRPGFSPTSQPVKVAGSKTFEIDLMLSVNLLNENVTVTADTGQAEEINRIPQQINIIGQDSLLQRSTAVLAQIADEETGVSLQRTSPAIGAVLVRGLTEVGVYVDGIRYTNSTQRGGINTFFNLNEPSGLQSVEIQRSPNTAQFGSDGLGGNLQMISRQPQFGFDRPHWNGEMNTFYNSSDRSFGGNALAGYGTKRFGILGNINARRINTLRTGGGIDSHSAITRFLGLPSNIIGGDRLPDTAFIQYGGTLQASLAFAEDQNLSFRYQRGQQDGGRRYDQLLGGDGNLIAELKNLMLDFAYLRYLKQGAGFFGNLSANVSYNSQREERINQGGQGNPLAAITNDKERTTSFGFGFYLDKQFSRNNFLVGGDYYHDRVNAPSFNTDPASGAVSVVRPRVPSGSTYDLAGIYVQDVLDAIPERLRVSGALRYNTGVYRSRAANSPSVGGSPLFPDDSARFEDYSGRIGATFTLVKGLNAAFNFSRGFRAPNITNLGGLGLVGVGFQVSATDVAGHNATVGSTADANAVSLGIPVSPLISEISNNYDISLRYLNRRFEANLTGFIIDYGNVIVRQTLILPQGSAGLRLGSQTIEEQNANGAVFVPASSSPVLVQVNLNSTRMKGVEFNFDYRFHDDWTAAGNYSYVYAADRTTGEPPNLGGGGIPPQFAFSRLRWQPSGKHFWIEGYASGSGTQSRLSTLDIADRRTGGARTRAQIANFIRHGACVRGLTVNLSGTGCGAASGNPIYILLATGETSAQVQNRVLPNAGSNAVPLFRSIPGYVLFNLRGGYRLGENQEFLMDLENIADKSHRAPGWGIDGPGRSLTLRYKYSF